MTLLAKRYATALFRLAETAGAVPALAGDLAAVHAALSSVAARALLQSPDVTGAERAVLLQKLGQGRHQLLQNLFGVLLHRRRLEVLFDLFPAFHALQLAARGELEGVVESPRALGAAELQALTALAGRLSGKKVTLTQALRPELIGGVRLKVGNVLYDGSLLASLEQLEGRLLQASL
ncbi:MAG: ATP synthase F1 subunit delta [Planctomycetes bacterium]|nr:ATP synthase F1 subunit delta [Planctomycetota bacterium]